MANWQEVKIRINRSALEGAYGILDNWNIHNFSVDDPELIDQAQRLGWGDYFPEVDKSEQATIACYFQGRRLGDDELQRLQADLDN